MSVEDGSQLSLLKHRSFAQFWLSRVLGSLANQMQTSPSPGRFTR